jgi:outer membrane autotransporter protein
MKRILFLLVFVAVMAALCSSSFATTIIAGSGPLSSTTDNIIFNNGGFEQTLTVSDGDNIFSLNSGTLALTPLAVATDNDSLSNITFNGNSSVYGGIGGAKVFKTITAGTLTGKTVSFLGAVNATSFSVGNGRVNFNSGTSNNGAMNFTGDGTISLNPNTTVIGALTTYAAQKGTLELGSGSILDGAVGGATGLKVINVIGGDSTAGVSARITGAVDTYSISLGTNILNIGPVGGAATGALTIHDAGVIDTILASSSVYGHIIPQGALTIGPTLLINVTVPSTAYIPVGTTFNIVDGTSGGVSVVTVDTVGSTNPLYEFSPVPLAGTAGDGKVTIKTDAIPLQASEDSTAPGAPVAAAVADVLEDIPSAPDIDAVRATLNALSDATDVVNAERQLAPSTPALAAPLETFYVVRKFQNLWSSRLDMCSQEANQVDANCQDKDKEPRSGWWVNGFEYEGHQNAREEFTGYTSRTLGTMVAYDRPIGENTRAGVGFGYARSTINGKTFDASLDFDTYRLAAYIGHERGPWYVNGSASVGWHEYSSMRHIVYTGMDRMAKAKYSGQDYTGFVSTGYHFYAKKFIITPLASLQYTRMHLNGYTEKNAGDVSLKVKSQSYDFLESGLGVKVERPFSDSHGRKYVPEMHFNWFHELSNPRPEQTARYMAAGSSQFKTEGLKTAGDTFNVGGGLTLLSCVCSSTTWSLEAV